VQVSEIGLGGNTFGNPVDAAGTKAIVDKALELGINFIDSAESYSKGVSEEHLGKALAGRRHDVVLATKTGSPGGEPGGRLTRTRLISRLEGSLKRLGTEYVDLYYFHFPDPLTPIDESLRAIDELVRAGKVRYPTVSNYQAWEVAEMVGICDRRGYEPPAASQVPFSLLERATEKEMVPACARFGISIVPYSPLAGGFLTGKYARGRAVPEGTRLARVERARQARLTDANFDALERYSAFASARGHTVGELAVSWLLAHPVVCSVIAGVTKPEQVEANAKAGEWVLSPDEVRDLA